MQKEHKLIFNKSNWFLSILQTGRCFIFENIRPISGVVWCGWCWTCHQSASTDHNEIWAWQDRAWLSFQGAWISECCHCRCVSFINRHSLYCIQIDKFLFCFKESINKAANAWGINCLRYEIKDVKLPERVQEAMQMQVEAERRKRAAILESEGLRESSINKAEGEKQSKILVSEAQQLEQINEARGEADAIIKIAQAKADSIRIMSESLRQNVWKNFAFIWISNYFKLKIINRKGSNRQVFF